jgi:hypothetical protein
MHQAEYDCSKTRQFEDQLEDPDDGMTGLAIQRDHPNVRLRLMCDTVASLDAR